MYTDPRYTIALMNVLNLDTTEFQSIHHRGKGTNPDAHLRYCEKIKQFPEDGTNAKFCQKLESLMLKRLYENAIA